MSNDKQVFDRLRRITGLASTWWDLELKIAHEMLAHAEHEKKLTELRELQQKVAFGLADFQVTRGAFAVPIGDGVLLVRNMHDGGSYYRGRSVEWYPDQTKPCLPDGVTNSEVPELDAIVAALDDLDQAGAAESDQGRFGSQI